MLEEIPAIWAVSSTSVAPGLQRRDRVNHRKVVSREGIEPSTRRLRVAPGLPDLRGNRRIPTTDCAEASRGRSMQPRRNRNGRAIWRYGDWPVGSWLRGPQRHSAHYPVRLTRSAVGGNASKVAPVSDTIGAQCHTRERRYLTPQTSIYGSSGRYVLHSSRERRRDKRADAMARSKSGSTASNRRRPSRVTSASQVPSGVSEAPSGVGATG